ncbi:chromate transporter [Candidatus Contubernalis alkaliaceticus]|uniref:chromate transporter n=1 Tax=Candidatus Contubernalis alkaliaceticus TaxID=338645 RepID=UPI001F4BF5C6|nr:chromate transporter [Candidatus Contubernalis alkalaceticus]UNC90972.1 chromate transporter [Candidatus Contubernalis alkalaceticus]
MLLLNIFMSFLKVGLFSFGGGYVMLPLIEKEVIRTNAWLTYNEFIDIIAIAEMTPGPIAINLATFVGFRVGGIPGALASTLGVVLPSFVIILIIARFLQKFYKLPLVQAAFKGLRPAVIALISLAAITIIQSTVTLEDLRSVFIALGSFLLLSLTRLNPILIIMAAGVAGFILYG